MDGLYDILRYLFSNKRKEYNWADHLMRRAPLPPYAAASDERGRLKRKSSLLCVSFHADGAFNNMW